MFSTIIRSVTIITLLFASSAAAQGRPCLSGKFSDNDPVVEVQIQFRFQEPRFHAQWFLQSLSAWIFNPDVDANARSVISPRDRGYIVDVVALGHRRIKPTRAVARDGVLHTIFCIRREIGPEEPLTVGFADRNLMIRARPITWNQIKADELARVKEVEVAPATLHIRYGTMPSVQLLDLAGPDWIVLSSFVVQRDASGRPMFYIELYNPHAEVHPPVEVALEFASPGTVRCAEPQPRPPAIEVRVHVKTDKKTTMIASTDPQFGGVPIVRNAVVSTESCWRLPMFTVHLGGTGPLVPGFSTVRYFFESSSLVLNGDVFASRGANEDQNRRDVFQWPWVNVLLEGRVFPPEISIHLKSP